jgi:hypothetical protein
VIPQANVVDDAASLVLFNAAARKASKSDAPDFSMEKWRQFQTAPIWHTAIPFL